MTMGGDGAVATMFQSTHPRGVRLRDREGRQGIGLVSIHAPAWGATFVGAPVLALLAGFNPRTRVGCDECKRQFSVVPKMFQSTHPRGVRLILGEQQRRGGLVSIHAPAWGATK